MRFLLIFILLFHKSIFCQSVLGIDVSMYQNSINWQNVLADGKTYAWAKATEGKTWTDPQFANNMTNGISAGVVMGAYHFARPDNNTAVEDATNFLNVAGNYIGAGFLPPALDLENAYTSGQVVDLTTLFTSNELTNWVQTWMTTVENQTGVEPIIYCNGNYASYVNSSLNNYGLWFAQPDQDTMPPTNIGNWNDWLFKQYSWTGTVSGISGDVDLNIFNGTLSEFNNLIGISNTGIASIKDKSPPLVYPNPFINSINLIDINGYKLTKIKIQTCEGKHIKTILNPTDEITLNDLKSGTYFLSFYNNQTKIGSRRIIKN